MRAIMEWCNYRFDIDFRASAMPGITLENEFDIEETALIGYFPLTTQPYFNIRFLLPLNIYYHYNVIEHVINTFKIAGEAFCSVYNGLKWGMSVCLKKYWLKNFIDKLYFLYRKMEGDLLKSHM